MGILNNCGTGAVLVTFDLILRVSLKEERIKTDLISYILYENKIF